MKTKTGSGNINVSFVILPFAIFVSKKPLKLLEADTPMSSTYIVLPINTIEVPRTILIIFGNRLKGEHFGST